MMSCETTFMTLGMLWRANNGSVLLGTNMIVHHTEDFTCSGDDGLAPAGLVLNCLCACPAARPSLVQASCENR